MITLDEAFKKFKSRLELSESEQKDASKRHYEVRDVIRESFDLENDFLTGSYARWTKTKPLKDVDVFCVLSGEKENGYLKKSASELLNAFQNKLAPAFGKENVSLGRRSVRVSFGSIEAEFEDKVMSIDVVPAFSDGKAYKIPDTTIGAQWIKTDPEIHAEKAADANKAFDQEWKPLVKMTKKWNNSQGKPIKPSFLVEVIALDILRPPFSGGYVYELKALFATAAERISETWEDPAGLGPPVSDEMDENKCRVAAQKLREVSQNVDYAIRLGREGKNGEALRVWRERIFGEMFPLS